MMESIWIMPRSTARSMDSPARQNGPRKPSRSARKARTSPRDLTGRDFGAPFCKASALLADAGLGEARHAAVASGGGAEDGERQGGTGALTQAHAEIEQRRPADCRQQP